MRALRHLPGVEVERFPPRWLMNLTALARRARPTRSDGAESAADPTWRQRLMGLLRRGGEALLSRRFRAACTRRRPDLYHEPNFIPLPSDLPTVTTVHDLSPLLHPEWHPADRVARYERRFRDGLARTDHVITDSEFVRREIIQVLGLPADRVTRVYIGVRPDFCPLRPAEVAVGLRRLGLPPEYLLYLGTLEPRKNLLTLMRAYCALPESVRQRLPLLLVGGWGWRADAIADYLKRVGEAHGIRHVGYVADAHLPLLYNGARALAFPSLYEGFGLPPVEMLACGGAVLASTAGAIAETVGGHAHLIAPEDEAGWREGLMRIATDDAWWRSLRRGAVEAVRSYTWENCARATLDVYRKVVEQTQDCKGSDRPLAA